MVTIFVIIPLASAFLSLIIAKKKEAYARYPSLISGFLLLLFSLLALLKVREGVMTYALGGWAPPFGICLELDGLNTLILLIINLIGFCALVYSCEYIRRYNSEGMYYTLFSLLLAGLNGVAISADLFNMFVFIEVASISSYALVAFGTEAEELEASFKYLVLGTIASMLILLAIGLIWGSVSTLNMADIARSLPQTDSKNLILFSVALFIAGFSIKAGLVPFHTWLPDAHPAAPAPVSAMLSGVVIKTLGIYALGRVIFNIIGFSPLVSEVFIWLGILSMAIGVLLAIGQWDFKRLLAYHSISQIGYVVFGIGLGTPLGIAGGLFHLFNHSLFKSLLFLNSGSVEYATGIRQLDKLGGLSKKMPFTSSTSLIASLSIAGIPPFCGFWSKLMIIIAAFQANNLLGGVICILVGMVTLASFLKVQKHAFTRSSDMNPDAKEVPRSLVLPMVLLALLCVIIGLFFVPAVDILIEPAKSVLLSGKDYAGWILEKF